MSTTETKTRASHEWFQRRRRQWETAPRPRLQPLGPSLAELPPIDSVSTTNLATPLREPENGLLPAVEGNVLLGDKKTNIVGTGLTQVQPMPGQTKQHQMQSTLFAEQPSSLFSFKKEVKSSDSSFKPTSSDGFASVFNNMMNPTKPASNAIAEGSKSQTTLVSGSSPFSFGSSKPQSNSEDSKQSQNPFARISLKPPLGENQAPVFPIDNNDEKSPSCATPSRSNESKETSKPIGFKAGFKAIPSDKAEATPTAAVVPKTITKDQSSEKAPSHNPFSGIILKPPLGENQEVVFPSIRSATEPVKPQQSSSDEAKTPPPNSIPTPFSSFPTATREKPFTFPAATATKFGSASLAQPAASFLSRGAQSPVKTAAKHSTPETSGKSQSSLFTQPSPKDGADNKPTVLFGAKSSNLSGAASGATPTTIFSAPPSAASPFSFGSNTSKPSIFSKLQSQTDEIKGKEKNKPEKEVNEKSHRERLVSFYQKHNPAKLATVDATLKKYSGKEEELFRKLKTKYEPEDRGFLEPTGTGPVCFVDFKQGRVKIQLFADKTPLAAENFRALCTGEKGDTLHFKDCAVHRIVSNFCVQTGDFTKGDGTGGKSIYPPGLPHTDMWGNFQDEQPFLKHSRRGLLSMANNGPNRNGSQWFVTLRALPHLDGKHVVFGEIIEGMEVVDAIAKVPTDSSTQRPLTEVTILDCGEDKKPSAAESCPKVKPPPVALKSRPLKCTESTVENPEADGDNDTETREEGSTETKAFIAGDLSTNTGQGIVKDAEAEDRGLRNCEKKIDKTVPLQSSPVNDVKPGKSKLDFESEGQKSTVNGSTNGLATVPIPTTRTDTGQPGEAKKQGVIDHEEVLVDKEMQPQLQAEDNSSFEGREVKVSSAVLSGGKTFDKKTSDETETDLSQQEVKGEFGDGNGQRSEKNKTNRSGLKSQSKKEQARQTYPEKDSDDNSAVTPQSLAKRAFDKLDKKKDGVLQAELFPILLEDLGEVFSRGEQWHQYDQIDKHGTGQLHRESFVSWYSYLVGNHKEATPGISNVQKSPDKSQKDNTVFDCDSNSIETQDKPLSGGSGDLVDVPEFWSGHDTGTSGSLQPSSPDSYVKTESERLVEASTTGNDSKSVSPLETNSKPFAIGSAPTPVEKDDEKITGPRTRSSSKTDQKPFVFGSSKPPAQSQSKTQPKPFDFGSSKQTMSKTNSEPFVFGSSKQLDEPISIASVPGEKGDEKESGPRESQSKTHPKLFDFGSSRSPPESLSKTHSKPFVFGSSKLFDEPSSIASIPGEKGGEKKSGPPPESSSKTDQKSSKQVDESDKIASALVEKGDKKNSKPNAESSSKTDLKPCDVIESSKPANEPKKNASTPGDNGGKQKSGPPVEIPSMAGSKPFIFGSSKPLGLREPVSPVVESETVNQLSTLALEVTPIKSSTFVFGSAKSQAEQDHSLTRDRDTTITGLANPPKCFAFGAASSLESGSSAAGKSTFTFGSSHTQSFSFGQVDSKIGDSSTKLSPTSPVLCKSNSFLKSTDRDKNAANPDVVPLSNSQQYAIGEGVSLFGAEVPQLSTRVKEEDIAAKAMSMGFVPGDQYGLVHGSFTDDSGQSSDESFESTSDEVLATDDDDDEASYEEFQEEVEYARTCCHELANSTSTPDSLPTNKLGHLLDEVGALEEVGNEGLSIILEQLDRSGSGNILIDDFLDWYLEFLLENQSEDTLTGDTDDASVSTDEANVSKVENRSSTGSIDHAASFSGRHSAQVDAMGVILVEDRTIEVEKCNLRDGVFSQEVTALNPSPPIDKRSGTANLKDASAFLPEKSGISTLSSKPSAETKASTASFMHGKVSDSGTFVFGESEETGSKFAVDLPYRFGGPSFEPVSDETKKSQSMNPFATSNTSGFFSFPGDKTNDSGFAFRTPKSDESTFIFGPPKSSFSSAMSSNVLRNAKESPGPSIVLVPEPSMARVDPHETDTFVPIEPVLSSVSQSISCLYTDPLHYAIASASGVSPDSISLSSDIDGSGLIRLKSKLAKTFPGTGIISSDPLSVATFQSPAEKLALDPLVIPICCELAEADPSYKAKTPLHKGSGRVQNLIANFESYTWYDCE